MSTLQVGDPAPDFTLHDQDGNEVSLAGLRGPQGRPLLLPQATTRRAARSRPAPCATAGTTSSRRTRCVYGVSPDSAASHVKFRAKYGLPFPLLADTEHAVAEAYGVWVEKTNYGKKYMGIERSTFLVDEDGTLERIWRRVKPDAAHRARAGGAAGVTRRRPVRSPASASSTSPACSPGRTAR